MEQKNITRIVREKYAEIAKQENGCGCGCSCGDGEAYVQSLGYSTEELGKIPDEANLALSCGNPTALAGLKEGEVVLDLGSGAGFDCFLAAEKVGSSGMVIGVDMTPEMLERARTIAAKENFENVEFRLGEIENLPAADSSADVVISNCVINLSADKERVFKEVYRVLKPGGRVAVSDVALLKDLPQELLSTVAAYVGCIAGAVHIDQYRDLVSGAGFSQVKITMSDNSFGKDMDANDPVVKEITKNLKPGSAIGDYAASIYVEAVKD